MKRFFKIALWSIGGLLLLLFTAGSIFVYKIKNGFPVSYETEMPSIEFPPGKKAVLLFSKSTGFRHEGSIEAGKGAFAALAQKNDWFLYSTEEGGVFNPEQLAHFSAVIFNNSTGRVLNDEQQKALEQYVEQGGSLIGIHGAGDNSHHWEWYVQHLTGSEFSHHAITAELQRTDVIRETVPDSLLSQGLPGRWSQADEWYVFFEQPEAKGFHILLSIDGETISPDGNILFVKDKNFGMGKHHPVAWYRKTGKGRTFYTSMGHDASAWQQESFVRLLENAVAY